MRTLGKAKRNQVRLTSLASQLSLPRAMDREDLPRPRHPPKRRTRKLLVKHTGEDLSRENRDPEARGEAKGGNIPSRRQHAENAAS